LQTTPKLGLKKPDLTDYVSVADLNENADLIDVAVGGLRDGTAVIPELQTTNKTLAGGINEVKSGLTTHLADIVTVATPNKILKLDAEAKLPTSITGDAATVGGKSIAELDDGAWEKIAEQKLSTSLTQIDFTNISTEYKLLKITFVVKSSTTTRAQLRMILNEDSGSTSYRTSIGPAGGPFAYIQFAWALPPSNSNWGLGEFVIANEFGKTKSVIGGWTQATSDGGVTHLNGHWGNVNSNINTLSLSGTIDMLAGSEFILWGVK